MNTTSRAPLDKFTALHNALNAATAGFIRRSATLPSGGDVEVVLEALSMAAVQHAKHTARSKWHKLGYWLGRLGGQLIIGTVWGAGLWLGFKFLSSIGGC